MCTAGVLASEPRLAIARLAIARPVTMGWDHWAVGANNDLGEKHASVSGNKDPVCERRVAHADTDL